MIIIQDTPKQDVLIAIDREIQIVYGLSDTIGLLEDSGKEGLKETEAVVQKNAILKSIESELRKTMYPGVTIVGGIEDALTKLKFWLPKLRERVVKSPTKIYDTETISFKEKGILDSVSSINFWTRYATMVLDVLLDQANKEQRLESLLTKVDFRFFNNTAKYFAHLTYRFSSSVKDLEGMIDNLSDETYDAVSEEIISAQLGDSGVSVQHHLAPHQLNPLHWWKNRRMKKDVSSLSSNTEAIEMLAMKIARLNNRRNGSDNPELDRQIETYQNAIIKKRAENIAIEAKYNGGRI